MELGEEEGETDLCVKPALAVTSCANEHKLPDLFKPQSSSSVQQEEADCLQRVVARMKRNIEPHELRAGSGRNGEFNKWRSSLCVSLLLSWPDPSVLEVTVTVLFFNLVLS